MSTLDPSGHMLDLALVAYTFTKGLEHEVMVRPHGNSRSGQPYQRTLPSTITLLKKCTNRPAKEAVSEITREQGGILSVRSAGSLPRDHKQVYNIRHQQKSSSGKQATAEAKEKSDVLYYLMEQSRACRDGQEFV